MNIKTSVINSAQSGKGAKVNDFEVSDLLTYIMNEGFLPHPETNANIVCKEQAVPDLSVLIGKKSYAVSVNRVGNPAPFTGFKALVHVLTQETVAVAANSSGGTLVGSVILRTANTAILSGATNSDDGLSETTLEYIEGTSPVALSDNDIQTEIGSDFFLRLANITVADGATEILDANIGITATYAFSDFFMSDGNDQTMGGVKSFTDRPSAGGSAVADEDLVTKKDLDDKPAGAPVFGDDDFARYSELNFIEDAPLAPVISLGAVGTFDATTFKVRLGYKSANGKHTEYGPESNELGPFINTQVDIPVIASPDAGCTNITVELDIDGSGWSLWQEAANSSATLSYDGEFVSASVLTATNETKILAKRNADGLTEERTLTEPDANGTIATEDLVSSGDNGIRDALFLNHAATLNGGTSAEAIGAVTVPVDFSGSTGGSTTSLLSVESDHSIDKITVSRALSYIIDVNFTFDVAQIDNGTGNPIVGVHIKDGAGNILGTFGVTGGVAVVWNETFEADAVAGQIRAEAFGGSSQGELRSCTVTSGTLTVSRKLIS